MYRSFPSACRIIATAGLAGLCGLFAATAPQPAAAEAADAARAVENAQASFGPGLDSTALDQTRGSGLLPEAPSNAARPSTTAVILWDEWKGRTGNGSAIPASARPSITVRVGRGAVYRSGRLDF